MPNYDEIKIKCPYCFEDFKSNTVIFRSNYKHSGTSNIKANNLMMAKNSSTNNFNSENDKIDQLYAPFEGPYSGKGKIDEKLEDFWLYKGGAEAIKADETWDYPHIDPSDASFKEMVEIIPEKTDEYGFVRDKDGWIIGIIPKRGPKDLAIKKLCPHCHNPLPFVEYGKYPTKFISIVGIKGSGKTVYLHQLLTKFPSVISQTPFVMGTNSLEMNKRTEKVARNYKLPVSTYDSSMRRPSAFILKYHHPKTEGMTAVFYDIAGENCLELVDDDADDKKRKQAITKFLAFCDGLLFLIDPNQIPIYQNQESEEIANIQDVINTVNEIRPRNNREKNNWDDIPVAVVLTKSDTIDNRLGDVSPKIFQEVSCKRNANGEIVKEFNREEFSEIDRALREEFSQKTKDIIHSLNSFPKKGFFAVSAITCGVENRFEKYKKQYTLTDENYAKFQDYFTWIKEWNDAKVKENDTKTIENRQHVTNGECYIKDSENKLMNIELTESIDDKCSIWNKATDVEAFCTDKHGCTGYINLTVADIANDVILEGYPIADPDPRRVEEPFLWILWQLGLIGPKWIPRNTEPQKTSRSFFNFLSRKTSKKEQDSNNSDGVKDITKDDFYACKDLSKGGE